MAEPLKMDFPAKCTICQQELHSSQAYKYHMTRKHGAKKKNVIQIDKKGGEHLENNVAQQIQYALGHTESWLESFSRLHGLPEQYVTSRVAELLLQTRKRAKHLLPQL